MPRICSVCVHPDREAIDQALVAGEAARTLASRYGTLGRMAMHRHAAGHLPAALAKAEAVREIVTAGALLSEANRLYATATAVMDEARAGGDNDLALKAITTAGRLLSLLGELLGELNRTPQINILVSPEWIGVRAALFSALAPYPDARTAVADRLLELEATNGHGG